MRTRASISPAWVLLLALSFWATAGFAKELPLPGGMRVVDSAGALVRLEDTRASLAKRRLSTRRIVVVVHGIKPEPSDLDPLSQDLARRGFTVFRFVYDDKARLDSSAARLRRALAQFERKWRPEEMAVVAHSMGGLVARRALTKEPLAFTGRDRTAVSLAPLSGRLTLVTIASPFGGFRTADWARLSRKSRRSVAGDLGTRAPFIQAAGELARGVTHFKIETDEGGHRTPNGKSDSKVRVRCQLHPSVDAGAKERIRLDLGHVASVNQRGRVPKEVRAALARALASRRSTSRAAPAPVSPAPVSRGRSRGLIGGLGR
jgi:pimeloyl-ACP methyl ester carboxylesterase